MNLLNKTLLILTAVYVFNINAQVSEYFFTVKPAVHPSGITVPTVFFYNHQRKWKPFESNQCKLMNLEERDGLTRYINKLKPSKRMKDACASIAKKNKKNRYITPSDFAVLKFLMGKSAKDLVTINKNLASFMKFSGKCEGNKEKIISYRSYVPKLPLLQSRQVKTSSSVCETKYQGLNRRLMQSLEVNAERIIDKESFFYSFFKFSSSIFIKEAMASVDMEEEDEEDDEAFDEAFGDEAEFKKEIKATAEIVTANKTKNLFDHCKNHSKLWVAGALESYGKGNKTKALKEADHALDNLEIAKEAAGLIKNEKEKAEKLKEIALEETNIKLVKEIIKKGEEIDDKKVKVATEEEIFDIRMAVNTYDAKAAEDRPGYRVTKLTVNEDGSEDKKEEVIKISENVTSYKDVPPKEKRELIIADLEVELFARGLDGISEESKKKIVEKIMELDRPDYNQILGREVTSKVAKKRLFERKLKNRRKIADRLPPKARRVVNAEISRLSNKVYDVATNIELEQDKRDLQVRQGKRKSFRANNMVAGTDLNRSASTQSSRPTRARSTEYAEPSYSNSSRQRSSEGITSSSVVDNTSSITDSISENAEESTYEPPKRSTGNTKTTASPTATPSRASSYQARRPRAYSAASRSAVRSGSSSIAPVSTASSGVSSSYSAPAAAGGQDRNSPAVEYERTTYESKGEDKSQKSKTESKVSDELERNFKKADKLKSDVEDYTKQIYKERSFSEIIDIIDNKFSKMFNKEGDISKVKTVDYQGMKCFHDKEFFKPSSEKWEALQNVFSYLKMLKSKNKFCIINTKTGELIIMKAFKKGGAAGYNSTYVSNPDYQERLDKNLIFQMLGNLSALEASQDMILGFDETITTVRKSKKEKLDNELRID